MTGDIPPESDTSDTPGQQQRTVATYLDAALDVASAALRIQCARFGGARVPEYYDVALKALAFVHTEVGSALISDTDRNSITDRLNCLDEQLDSLREPLE